MATKTAEKNKSATTEKVVKSAATPETNTQPAKKVNVSELKGSKTAKKSDEPAKTVVSPAKKDAKSAPGAAIKATPKETAENMAPSVEIASLSEKPEAKKKATDKWSAIRGILMTMKQDAMKEIIRTIKNSSESSATEETTGDIYDQASSERDRELELLLNDREREKVHSIDEALLRMSEGEYGVCEECEEEIPVGRLKVLPFTRHCVRCKSDLEKIQAQTRWVDDSRAYREIPAGDEEEG